MTAYVCDRCGGSNVFHDAYVGVNDPTDVLTFSATFCLDCEGKCGLQPVERVYVLSGLDTDDDGSPLYWSNDLGWVDRQSATIFTVHEIRTMREPFGAREWEVAS